MPVQITIIGAGPGGYVAALRAARMGARVAVVEDSEVGGTCLNWGCIPTKTIIASARALEQIRSASDFGIEVSGTVGFNLAKIRDRKDKVVSTQIKGIRGLFKSWGIRLIEGRGALVAPGLVRVEQKDGTAAEINSDRIIIATGSKPALIPGFSFDMSSVLTSDDAVRLSTIPPSILIVGAGVIGSEFAFIYRAFGSDVTLVEMMPRALATEDQEISELIAREMKKAKIRLVTGVKVERIVKSSDGKITAALSDGREITTDQILVSVGRSMNSRGIGLKSVGVNTGNNGEILVNRKMETNVPGVYAIGDVTGKIMLAHVASHQGLVAVDNALGRDSVMDYSVIPSAIFTMPEIGSVGLREQQAVAQGIKYRAGRFQFRALGKAHAMGEISGMVKIISEAETDKVLGVHIFGAHATDLIHEGALAMKMGATAAELGRTVHAHPTLSEALMEAAEDVHGMAVHVPKKGIE